ncbi:sulfate reduction electron transfer complex DsrMKJOP subunit DsrO [Inmirania thermothiophila]|uniref:Molybdopterin-containing oxidoreductase family iron-sulfur binding subunit n=1 Tax=Inmirania thermothiophila TaxID=1750597 RepID=A0A3N1Y4G0_9GAMM|nr:4Fe-4S dicluster domain-containing protein [Inmirania thermothiophila]ROR32167.1 molybdopterin-containing oxidoreductase family iron-sulfur binding subunit [Inmirania thermothiophila]
MAEQAATRRDFLRAGGALAAGVLLAPGVFLLGPAAARPAGEPASSRQRWGLLVDTRRCADGCDACVSACREENGWGGRGRPETDPQWIRKVRVRDPRSGRSFSLPVMCQHCAHPPCVDVCPTGASMRRADGIVLVDRHRCIGCRYCMMACPYKARSLEHEAVEDPRPWAPRGKGTVESCTLCVHRVDAGREPACVEACRRTGNAALVFGDLADPASEIARSVRELGGEALRADLGLDPGVRYLGLNV